MYELQIIEEVPRTLIIRFKYIVATTKEYDGLTTTTLDDLVRSLMAHEERMLEKSESKGEVALRIQMNSRKKWILSKVMVKQVKKVQRYHKFEKKNMVPELTRSKGIMI